MPSAEYRTPDIIGPLATFLHACLQRQPKIHEKVSMYLQEPKFSTQATELLDLLTKVARDVAPESSKDRDYEWFKGLDTSYKTKEDVMRNSADRRMRGYLMHTKTELNKDRQLPAVSSYNQAVEFLKNQLSINKYNAKYFDRKAAPGERLCDANGLFECEGPYNTDRCPGIHFINPYASREMRIMFSTWNLDHIIEKSRAVIPALKSALYAQEKSKGNLKVNLPYFYDLLFTHKNANVQHCNGNLKLVHTACHDKKCHEFKCEKKKIYLPHSLSKKERQCRKKIKLGVNCNEGNKPQMT
ncbi:DNA fragmentation factor subunit beta-like isoform X2 [Homarus americanus]|nr:DNA fragmentation factor subunit beta-like isoform X2 [Homarus americanus]